MIDCGEDRLGKVNYLRLSAITITHTHPDHAYGLQDGVPWLVFTTRETRESMPEYDLSETHEITPRKPLEFGDAT